MEDFMPNFEKPDDLVLEALPLIRGCTPETIARLLEEVAETHEKDNVKAQQLNLEDEIHAQMTLVQTMRTRVTDSGEEIPVREIKEVVTASNTLLGTLMKMQEKINSIQHQQAVEQSVMDTMDEMPEEIKESFLCTLERKLEAIT